jgi:hypothetical protein
MAKLMLIGKAAEVELTTDPEDGQIIATCEMHEVAPGISINACSWTERYDTLDDASEYATNHADTGRSWS